MRISKEEDGSYECNYVAHNVPNSISDVRFHILKFIDEYVSALIDGKMDFRTLKTSDGVIIVSAEVCIDPVDGTGTGIY